MANYQKTRRYSAYGLVGPMKNLFPDPVVTNRAPGANDVGYEIGQQWIDEVGNNWYVLTSIVSGVPNWLSVSAAGSFTSLAVSGSATIGTGLTVTAGGATIGGTLTQTGGNVSIGADAAAQTVLIGTGAAAKTVTIGSTTAGSTLALNTPTSVYTVAANGISITTAGRGISLPGSVLVLSGSGDPNATVTAAQGSLFLRTDGSSTSTRAYINTDGTTAWTAITTAT